MQNHFTRATQKIKFAFLFPPEADLGLRDTREFRTCPHCRGDGSFTDHIDPGILVSMPCAGCDGRGEVLDGIGYNADANEWECWVWGELYWARSEAIATRMYRENLAMFRRHFLRLNYEIYFKEENNG